MAGRVILRYNKPRVGRRRRRLSLCGGVILTLILLWHRSWKTCDMVVFGWKPSRAAGLRHTCTFGSNCGAVFGFFESQGSVGGQTPRCIWASCLIGSYYPDTTPFTEIEKHSQFLGLRLDFWAHNAVPSPHDSSYRRYTATASYWLVLLFLLVAMSVPRIGLKGMG
jgi:hypothetical protein